MLAKCTRCLELHRDGTRPKICQGGSGCIHEQRALEAMGRQLRAGAASPATGEEGGTGQLYGEDVEAAERVRQRAELDAAVTQALSLCDAQGRVALRLGAMVLAWMPREYASKIAQTVKAPGVLACSPTTGLEKSPEHDPLTGRALPESGRARIVLVLEVPFD